ncbi:MAG: hypothetical protein ACXV3U_05855 [Halobacteriota archaeon]
MRERHEQNERYYRLKSSQPSSLQRNRQVERKQSRQLGKKVSVGIMLMTLTLLLITVGYTGYWDGGVDLIDHDTATYVSLAKYVQQNGVLSPSNPNAAPSDVWWNDQPPGLPILFSAVAIFAGVNINLNSDLLLLMQGFSAFILVAFILTTFVVVKKITGDTRIAALASFFSATFSPNQAILGPQYIVPSSFGLILMYLGTYYLFAIIKDDANKSVFRSSFTLLGVLTVTTLILVHRLSATTFYYIFTAFIVLYVLINLGVRMHFRHLVVLIVAPLLLSAPWWFGLYSSYSILPWSIPEIMMLAAGMLVLMMAGVLFSGSTERRSPHNRRDRLFAVIGHTTKNALNSIIVLVAVAIILIVLGSAMFSFRTALSLGFIVSSLGLIPILSILVYKTTLWDKPETNLRNMIISSWLFVALIPTLMGVLGVAVLQMPWLIQRIVPHTLANQDAIRSILYLVLPLSILASILVFRLAYEERPQVQGLRRRKDRRVARSLLIIIFVLVSVFSPVLHIAATTALAANAQTPKLTEDEMNALQWLNTHGSAGDGVLSDPTLTRYISTFTNKQEVLSTESENSYVVTHQISQLNDLSNFMNSSTDSATKLLIAKKMDAKYFVYDKTKADYSSSTFQFPFATFDPNAASNGEIMTEVFKNNDVTIYQIDQGKLSATPTRYASIDKVDVYGDTALVYLANHASDPMSLHLAWQDNYKPVTLNGGETKGVRIDLSRTSSGRLSLITNPFVSSSSVYVSLWMDPPSSNGTIVDAKYTTPIDAVNVNSEQLFTSG